MKYFILLSFCWMIQATDSYSLCPNGWHEFKDDCYIINATITTLPIARQFCGSFGDSSKLLTVRSEDPKKKFLHDFIIKFLSINGHISVWMNAIENSSHYEWPENHRVVEGIENVNSCPSEWCNENSFIHSFTRPSANWHLPFLLTLNFTQVILMFDSPSGQVMSFKSELFLTNHSFPPFIYISFIIRQANLTNQY